QILSTNTTNATDTENSNIDLLFEEEELEEETLEFDIKVVNIDIRDELVIEEFFDMNIFRQYQDNETCFQEPTTSTKDWTIDDIFSQVKT
ncbi:6704_t:CDS:2, partial [Racocetra persica]